ncbi:MAG TPA: N-acetyltransferase [Thermoplasmatales archaeon]|nr:MAG: transferase [Thermoplasmata archaeon]HDN50536.1 N-acetyltransferase [Thermoplasmatales archaeon]
MIGKNAVIEEHVVLGVQPKKATGELVIGDNATIRSHTVIYAGNVIGDHFQTGHGALIRENNRIGNNVSVGSHTVIERENVIEDNVRIHTGCFIPEFVVIKKGAWLGPRTTILNVLHPPCPKFEECAKSVVIEEHAKIGGNVTILPRVTIGRNALIGAGSVVTRDIPPDSVAVGNPARVTKTIKDLDCILGYYDTPYEWEE